MTRERTISHLKKQKKKKKKKFPKPVEKHPEKMKAGLENTDKPLRKKAKRDKSPKGVGKGDDFVQKSAEK